MTTKPPIPLLQGDCLLYNTPWDFVDFLIRVKTWSPVAHVEIYRGNEQSFASRNGIGVNAYPLRLEGLVAVLRPHSVSDWSKAEDWFFRVAQGQKYDWLGLMCFTLAVKRGSQNRMFCSEFSTRFYRQAKTHAFNPHWDADKIAPGNNLMSPAFDWAWTNGSIQ